MIPATAEDAVVNWPLIDPPPIEQVEEENSEGGEALIAHVVLDRSNPDPVTTTTVPIGPELGFSVIDATAETYGGMVE